MRIDKDCAEDNAMALRDRRGVDPCRPSRRRNLSGWGMLPVVLLILSLCSSGWAGRVLKVPGEYTTIQKAINAAAMRDEIWVSQGIYREKIKFRSGITLLGGFVGGEGFSTERNPDVNPTIIDGSTADNGKPASNVVLMDGASSVVLDGFIVQGGNQGLGSGIDCQSLQGAIISIRNCTIRCNQSASRGGGIRVYGVNATIENCKVIGNTAKEEGGGMCIEYPSTVSLINCLFAANSSSSWGGGLATSTNFDNPYGIPPLNLSHCRFVSNSASAGGAEQPWDGQLSARAACLLAIEQGQEGEEE